MVKIRLGTLIAENILKMVCSKRPTILPLRVAETIAFTDGDPTVAADGLPRPGVGLLKPRDHQWRFWLELAMRHIIIRQRDVERILPRDERDWDVIPARARLRVIRAAVIRCPIEIPATLVIRNRIVSAGLFPHPEDCSDDIHFPRIPLDRRPRAGRDKDLRLHSEQRLLPQLHRVSREIGRRRVGRSGLFVPEDFRGASNCKTETNREKSLHADRRFFYGILRLQARRIFTGNASQQGFGRVFGWLFLGDGDGPGEGRSTVG